MRKKYTVTNMAALLSAAMMVSGCAGNAGAGIQAEPESMMETEAVVETSEEVVETIPEAAISAEASISIPYGSRVVVTEDEMPEREEGSNDPYYIQVEITDAVEWSYELHEVESEEEAVEETENTAEESEQETAEATESEEASEEEGILFNTPGVFEIVITAIGQGENETTFSVAVNVFDGVAPELEVEDISVTKGGKVDYMKSVKAVDEIDGDLTEQVEVDASSVDLATTGKYTVAYSVSDAAGNKAEAEATVTVKEKNSSNSSASNSGSTSSEGSASTGSGDTSGNQASSGSTGNTQSQEEAYQAWMDMFAGMDNPFSIAMIWEAGRDDYRGMVTEEQWNSVNAYVMERTGGKTSAELLAEPTDGNTGSSQQPSTRPQTPERTHDRNAALEAFNYQNEVRASVGAPALEWDEELYNLCIGRSEQIIGDFSHSGVPDGCGENIAKGSSSAYAIVYDGWCKSEGHYNNMINDRYTKGAIANYGDHWVALFKY